MKIRLKEFRQMHGMRQKEMAELLGVNQSVISRMEVREYPDLSAPQVKTLAERFGEEEVELYKYNPANVNISDNTNTGSGTQNNSIRFDGFADIAAHQMELMTHILRKQAAQTDRLLEILAQLAENRRA